MLSFNDCNSNNAWVNMGISLFTINQRLTLEIAHLRSDILSH